MRVIGVTGVRLGKSFAVEIILKSILTRGW